MTCAHRNLHPGRVADVNGGLRTRCLDCGAVLSLVPVYMTDDQRADVHARLESDLAWTRGVRPAARGSR